MSLEKFETIYAENNNIPWDDDLPPPELITTASTLDAGRFLDIGCGYGRAAIYLAKRDWKCVGVDFVESAIVEAKRRATAANVTPDFHQGDVTNLDFLQKPFDLILDVGCLHGISAASRAAYAKEITRLAQPNAWYLLFARLWENPHAPPPSGASGISEGVLKGLFEPAFTLAHVEYGETVVSEGAPWQSAWYWWQKVDNN